MSGNSRELTCEERAAIKKLVIKMCANYQHGYGCMPLDCECYMLGKWWTGAYCRYFQNAVLPLEPALEAALMGRAVDMRPCALCGRQFPMKGKKAYCSEICQQNALRRQKREYMRRKRVERGNFPYK